MATIAYGTAAGHCQTSQAGTTKITFQSATYNDMRRLLARETTAGAVTVEATLGFPEQTKDHYPAVIDCAIAGAATVEVAAVAAITFSRSRRFMLVPSPMVVPAVYHQIRQ